MPRAVADSVRIDRVFLQCCGPLLRDLVRACRESAVCANARAKLRSLYPISAVSEPSSGIVCGNGLECFGDGLIQSFLAASFGGTEELFELRPSLLDGVQVGRVGR